MRPWRWSRASHPQKLRNWTSFPHVRIRFRRSHALPLEQLRLSSEEIDRELASVSARQSNAVTRASIVLAAAGISAFADVGTSLGWNLVPATFSAVSALLCLLAIRYWTSEASQIRTDDVKRFLKKTEYEVMWRLVADKYAELQAARADLERKADLVEGAVGMLILAWMSALVVKFIVEPVLTGTGY